MHPSTRKVSLPRSGSTSEAARYQGAIERISVKHGLAGPIGPTFMAVLDFVLNTQFRGACHATTGILHVLLQHQGVHGKLVSGELQHGRLVFNHSWLEVTGKIFDVGISLPLQEDLDSSPVFAGYDVATLRPPIYNYNFRSGLADDTEVGVIKTQTFVAFMDNAPFHPQGLWFFVQAIGKTIGLKLNIDRQRRSHAQDQWEFR